MNIFYLSHCPKEAAQMLINCHLAKMIVETSQMLSNCFELKTLESAPKTQNGGARKHSYPNHPCSIWARSSLENMEWVINNALAMQEEREFRFQSKKHFSLDFILWTMDNADKSIVDSFEKTPPALAMKQYAHFMDVNDPVRSYQQFYSADKRFDSRGRKIDIYTNRKKPEFWKKYERQK